MIPNPATELMDFNAQVVWDGYGLANPYSGVFHHAKNLLINLNKLAVEPAVIMAECEKDSYFAKYAHTIQIGRGIFPPLTMSKIFWPKRAEDWALRCYKEQKYSTIIYHGLSNININLFGKTRGIPLKRVITIHDLTPFLWPKCVSKSYYYQLKFALRFIVNKVDAIICVSNWTRQSLLSFFPEMSHKTEVVFNGIQKQPKNGATETENNSGVKKKPNILFISRFEKYKRFELLAKIINENSARYSFTIVTDLLGEKFLKENASAQATVEIKKELDDQQIKKVFDRCNILLVTSLSEGFCLPAAQAASLGRPVVFTSGSAIDEVINPQNCIGLAYDEKVSSWTEALAQCLSLSPLTEDEIDSFLLTKSSWEEAAKKLKIIYNKLNK